MFLKEEVNNFSSSKLRTESNSQYLSDYYVRQKNRSILVHTSTKIIMSVVQRDFVRRQAPFLPKEISYVTLVQFQQPRASLNTFSCTDKCPIVPRFSRRDNRAMYDSQQKGSACQSVGCLEEATGQLDAAGKKIKKNATLG